VRYLYALLALGLLLAVHELGHLLMARLLGLRVERFSLGFGPRCSPSAWGAPG
jgi:regulator of sigma E protease